MITWGKGHEVYDVLLLSDHNLVEVRVADNSRDAAVRHAISIAEWAHHDRVFVLLDARKII